MDASKFLEKLFNFLTALDNYAEIDKYTFQGYRKYTDPWDRKNGFEFKDDAGHLIRFRMNWDFPHHNKLTDYLVFEVVQGMNTERIGDCQLRGNNFYLHHGQVRWIDNYKLNVRMDQKLTLDLYYKLMEQFGKSDKTIIGFNPNAPNYAEIMSDMLDWVLIRYQVKNEIRSNPQKYFR